MQIRSVDAIRILLGLNAATIVFHAFILLKIVPYHIAWGGRLQNDSEMYAFEIVSILINLFFCLVLLMKANYLKFRFSPKAINLTLWIFLVIFGLNTLGNLFAETTFEKCFSALTLFIAGLIWIILREKTPKIIQKHSEHLLTERQ